MEADDQQNGRAQRESGTVILIPGLLVPPWTMRWFRDWFKERDYSAQICNYQTVRNDLNRIADRVAKYCLQVHDSNDGDVFIVGHSLGAILARLVVEQVELKRLRRVVMLAPPNQGSHVASKLGKFVRWCVPVMEQISDQPDSLVNRLPRSMKVETGIVACTPDFVIHEPATHLENETDHINLRGPHGALIFRRSVFNQTLHFIEHGAFDHSVDQS